MLINPNRYAQYLIAQITLSLNRIQYNYLTFSKYCQDHSKTKRTYGHNYKQQEQRLLLFLRLQPEEELTISYNGPPQLILDYAMQYHPWIDKARPTVTVSLSTDCDSEANTRNSARRSRCLYVQGRNKGCYANEHSESEVRNRAI